MIPKIIFQTHEYDYDDLPKWFKETSMSWQNLNPDWGYVYHNQKQRSDYVRTQSPEMYRIYNEIHKPHQADLWRYLILRNEGGVYADMDSFCSTPLDYILSGLPENIDIVSTKTEKRNHTNNSNFAAVKNSKILNECIEKIIYANRKERKRNQPDQKIIHDCFSDGVLNNLGIVSQTMQAYHGSTFKTSFDQSILKVNDYGQELTYPEFLSKHNVV